jgi:hypothetical protein
LHLIIQNGKLEKYIQANYSQKKEKGYISEKSKTGVKYITLVSGKGFRFERGAEESKRGKVEATFFSFGFYKGIRPAFERAVKARYKFEMGKYGKSIIRLDKMDEYFELTQKNYGDKLKWL